MQNFWNLKFLRTPAYVYTPKCFIVILTLMNTYIYIYVHMRMLTNYKCTVSVYAALQAHAYICTFEFVKC